MASKSFWSLLLICFFACKAQSNKTNIVPKDTKRKEKHTAEKVNPTLKKKFEIQRNVKTASKSLKKVNPSIPPKNGLRQ